MYHWFGSWPFFMLIMVFAMRHMAERGRKWEIAIYVFLGLAALCFILFYPVLTGITVPTWYEYILKWLPTWPVI